MGLLPLYFASAQDSGEPRPEAEPQVSSRAALRDDADGPDGCGDDDEEHDGLAEELQEIEAELSGGWHDDCADGESVAAEGSEDRRDLDDLENVHRRFVAAAVERRMAGEAADSLRGGDANVEQRAAGEEDEDVLEDMLNEGGRAEPTVIGIPTTSCRPITTAGLYGHRQRGDVLEGGSAAECC